MWQDSRLMNAIANGLFGLCALLLVCGGVWFVVQRPMFTLAVIEVDGKQGETADHAEKSPLRHVNALTIRNAALPHIKGNFFTANLDQVRAAFEMVPWVRRASVKREWPNKLIVSLEEHRSLGSWGEDGQLLSDKGELFTANFAEAEEDNDNNDLIAFAGPEGSEKEVWARYHDFKQWFKTANLEPESVTYTKRYAWLVQLNNGITVQLGREQDGGVLKERVDRLLRVYPQLEARLPGQIESVDLRYPNGLALKAGGAALEPREAHGKSKAVGKGSAKAVVNSVSASKKVGNNGANHSSAADVTNKVKAASRNGAEKSKATDKRSNPKIGN